MMSKLPYVLFATTLLGACAVGPDYHRPAMTVPAQFKEAPAGWKQAKPSAAAIRGEWWKAFSDPQLDQLVIVLNAHNQSVAAAFASYREARATAQAARAGFFPSLTGTLGANRGNAATGGASVVSANSLSLDASWEPDLWGAIRRAVEAGNAQAEASAANLAVARLAVQAELVQDYLQMYVADRQRVLAEESVKDLQRTAEIAQNQLDAGLVTPADVAQANAQVQTTRNLVLDDQLAERQYEHAIAALIGVAPASFRLTMPPVQPVLPEVPPQFASSLLERRPDIAGAERNVMAENAQIGVAKSAYFPALTLSASAGHTATQFADVLSSPLKEWSIGAALAGDLFDAGARAARVDAATAAYDASVAQYRQTVLNGLQEVEDNLVAMKLLAQEADQQKVAVAAAERAEAQTINEYRVGTVDFTSVASAQTARRQADMSALQILGRRYSATATLIKALGGGWDGDLAPTVASVSR